MRVKPSGAVELKIPFALRVVYAALGAALIAILSQSETGRPFAIAFAIIMCIVVLSEDRWTFDPARNEIRRRYGILILAKSWAIDADMIASVELDTEFNQSDMNDPYGKVHTIRASRKSAVRLILSDGRGLVICAASDKKLPELKHRAETIAGAMGKALVEV